MYICQILFCFQDPESCGRAALTVVAEIQRGLKRWLSQVKIFKGGFPLLRNFYVSTHVNFTRVNKIEAMYGRSRVNVKVEPRSTFTLSRGVSYIAYISFTHVIFMCVRTEKLRHSGNQP